MHAQDDDQLCDSPVTDCDEEKSYFPEDQRIDIEYANSTIQDIKYSNTYVDFTVLLKEPSNYSCRFVVCGCPTPDTPDFQPNATFYISPSSVYVAEGPSIALLASLYKDLDPLTYVLDVNNVFNGVARTRVSTNKTKQAVAPESILSDFELLAKDKKLSAILASGYDFSSFSADLKDAGSNVPSLPMGELFEGNPLARAEWVKVVGLLFNKSAEANNIFSDMVTRYNEAKDTAANATRRPSVFFNTPYTFELDELWTQPGGDSYIAHYMRDANAAYRLSFDAEGETHNVSTAVNIFSSTRFLLNAALFGSQPSDLTMWMNGILEGNVNESLLSLTAVRLSLIHI